MRLFVALVALIGLIQAVVWIGRPEATSIQRALGTFAAPIAVLLFGLAVAATRLPGLLF